MAANTETETEPFLLSPSKVTMLNRCTVCSEHFEQPRHCFVQPEVNRIICKVLDVYPGPPPNSTSYFSSYVPICQDCIRKIRKYDRLRVEVEALRREIVTAIVDSIVYIRPNDETPLKFLKDQIVRKWVTKDGEVEIGLPETVPQSPSKGLRTPEEKKGTTSRPVANMKTKVIPKSPPQPTSNYLERQQGSVLTFTAPHSLDLTQVSIVAYSETEALAILAAYVAEQGGAQAQTLDDDGDVPEHDDSYFEAGLDYDDPAEPDEEWVEKSKGNTTKSTPKRVEVSVYPSQSKRKTPRTHFHPNARPPYFCEKCGQVSGRIDVHRRHLEYCDGPGPSAEADEQVITCSICSVSDFEDWVALKFHIDEFHSDCVLDKCKLCKRDFLPNTIEGHSCFKDLPIDVPESSDPADKEPYKCSYCEMVYYKRGSLGEHVRKWHKDKPRFTCTVCRKQFFAECLLKTHSGLHTRASVLKARFKCNDCGTSCTTRAGLLQHKTLHTGERPFDCEVCGKGFRLAQTRNAHMVIHSKERNYSCDHCGLTFRLHAIMVRHMKLCKKPQPPKKGKWCPICLSEYQLFLRLRTLQGHMSRCHPGTPEQIEICKEEGNRLFGFEAQHEDEIRKILASRPAQTYTSQSQVQKPTSSPGSLTGRKRTPTKRKIEEDSGSEEDSTSSAESEVVEDSESEEEQPQKKLQKRRARLRKAKEAGVIGTRN